MAALTQAETFDPNGDYFVHRPWTAPHPALQDAGIRLGPHYPLPIIHHAKARDRTLAAFAATKHQPPL